MKSEKPSRGRTFPLKPLAEAGLCGRERWLDREAFSAPERGDGTAGGPIGLWVQFADWPCR